MQLCSTDDPRARRSFGHGSHSACLSWRAPLLAALNFGPESCWQAATVSAKSPREPLKCKLEKQPVTQAPVSHQSLVEMPAAPLLIHFLPSPGTKWPSSQVGALASVSASLRFSCGEDSPPHPPSLLEQQGGPGVGLFPPSAPGHQACSSLQPLSTQALFWP